jgi:hypothetical protein
MLTAFFLIHCRWRERQRLDGNDVWIRTGRRQAYMLHKGAVWLHRNNQRYGEQMHHGNHNLMDYHSCL